MSSRDGKLARLTQFLPSFLLHNQKSKLACHPHSLLLSRTGGKKKPLKAPKKTKVMDEDDLALKKKLLEDQQKLKKAQQMAASKGPIGVGNKKVTAKK